MKKEKKLESLNNLDLFDSTNISRVNGGAFIESIYCTKEVELSNYFVSYKVVDGVKVGNNSVPFK